MLCSYKLIYFLHANWRHNNIKGLLLRYLCGIVCICVTGISYHVYNISCRKIKMHTILSYKIYLNCILLIAKNVRQCCIFTFYSIVIIKSKLLGPRSFWKNPSKRHLLKKKLSKNMNVIGITLKMIINVTRGHSSGCDELAK